MNNHHDRRSRLFDRVLDAEFWHSPGAHLATCAAIGVVVFLLSYWLT